MLITELYNGQGLGNQLWCYFTTRCIAEKNGYDFGIMSKEKFKGKDFMTIDFGGEVIGGSGPEGGPPNVLPKNIINYYKERIEHHHITGNDISKPDNILLNIPDNTKIDGVMQSISYIKHNKNKILSWLKIDQNKSINNYIDDNICIIHIRAGDYIGTHAFLDLNFYKNSINEMIKINSNMKFFIVTDDPYTARQILPNIEIIGSSLSSMQDPHKGSHHMGGPIWIDYTILNNAKYCIISSSTFAWWAVWTNLNIKKVIAPKYWFAYKQSDGFWSVADSITDGFDYMDRFGKLFNSKDC